MSTWDAVNAWLSAAYFVGAVIDVALVVLPGVAVTLAARCGWYAVRGWRERRSAAVDWLAAAQDTDVAPPAATVPPRIDTRPGTDQHALHTCQAIAAATRKETS